MINPDLGFEKSLLPTNTRFLLGIDEVGRGPWAGPVNIGAFLIDLNNFDLDLFQKLKVRDSKKLSPSQRQSIAKEFKNQGFDFKVFSASSKTIDEQGITFAIDSLINSALIHFRSLFDFALVDGKFNFASPQIKSLVSADSKTFSVASASIIAKVVRDLKMIEYHQFYPQYGFDKHKGYGTRQHLLALQTHGPCPIHRYSYRPLKKLIAK